MQEKRLAVTVPQRLDGATVKDVARSCLSLSSTRLKKAKRVPGGILRNGRGRDGRRAACAPGTCSPSSSRRAGARSEDVVPVAGDLDVRYEDEHLLVLNKPAGMPVHPSPGHEQDTLANRVVARYGEVFRPVNRLDAGTTGLMVAARNAHVHARLSAALHTENFERRYLAVVEGAWREREGTVDAPIARAPGSAIRRCVDPAGQRAVTPFSRFDEQWQVFPR